MLPFRVGGSLLHRDVRERSRAAARLCLAPYGAKRNMGKAYTRKRQPRRGGIMVADTLDLQGIIHNITSSMFTYVSRISPTFRSAP